MPRYVDQVVSDSAEMDFTVDISVPEVAVNPIVTDTLFFQAAFPRSAFFEPRDNLLIPKMYLMLPHGFRRGDGVFSFLLAYYDGSNFYYPPELNPDGIIGGIIFPPICGEISYPGNGLYLQPSLSGLPAGARFRLALVNFLGLNVSMAGVPDILDGETFQARIGLQIQHTRPLVDS